jgi:hypothetical protein
MFCPLSARYSITTLRACWSARTWVVRLGTECPKRQYIIGTNWKFKVMYGTGKLGWITYRLSLLSGYKFKLNLCGGTLGTAATTGLLWWFWGVSSEMNWDISCWWLKRFPATSKVKVTLRPTVSRPISLGVKPQDQPLVTVRQLRVFFPDAGRPSWKEDGSVINRAPNQ